MSEHHEIQYLRRMLAALGPSQKSQLKSVADVKERLRSLRHYRNDRRQYLKGWLAKQERDAIESLIVNNGFTANTRTTIRVNVGRSFSGERNWVNHEPGSGRTRHSDPPRIEVYVGHMWRRNVWMKLLKGQNFKSNDNYFITSAVEYRVNVPHIRLYEAKVWNRKTKEMCRGFIGQSKIGKQKSAFGHNKNMAIQLATQLVTKELDAQLSGENK